MAIKLEVGKKYKCKHPDVKYICVDHTTPTSLFRVYSCTIELVTGDSITHCEYTEEGFVIFIDINNTISKTFSVNDTQDLDITEEYDPGTAFKAMQDVVDPSHPDLKDKCSDDTRCRHGEYANQSLNEANPVWACKFCGKSKTDCEEELAEHTPDNNGWATWAASTKPVKFTLQGIVDAMNKDNWFGSCDTDDD